MVQIAIITKTYTFTAGAVIVASEHNTNFDTLYNDYNGNITNANIASGAAIDDAKLDTIDTYGKVSGAAISSLASINSAAGLVPTRNLAPMATMASSTLGSIPYFSSIGTMSALASGASGSYLMSTSTTSSPVWSNLSTFLGIWSDVTAAINTSLVALTDGLAIAYVAVGPSSGFSSYVVGYTDANVNPATIRGFAGAIYPGTPYDPIAFGTFTIPVKKNDYWKAVLTNVYGTSITTLYWISLGF